MNVHPTDYWAEQFARQGFYRDVDFDASFITPWAALFRKSGEPIHRLIKGYERRFWEMQSSANGARSYAIELQERVTRTEAERDRLRGELAQVHADLGQARTEVVEVHAELNRSHTHAREQAAAYAAERDMFTRQLSFATQTIANMERSVFWRIRGAYLKIRRTIQPRAS